MGLWMGLWESNPGLLESTVVGLWESNPGLLEGSPESLARLRSPMDRKHRQHQRGCLRGPETLATSAWPETLTRVRWARSPETLACLRGPGTHASLAMWRDWAVGFFHPNLNH